MITLTLEQFKTIARLSDFADFYIDDLEPSNPCYQDDKEDIRAAQDVISQIEQMIVKG